MNVARKQSYEVHQTLKAKKNPHGKSPMNKRLKNKNLKTRKLQIINYLVLGVLCGSIVYCAITLYKNSSEIERLKAVKHDVKYIKECMVNIGEKVGMTPGELTVLVSLLQVGEIEKRQPINRKVVVRKKIVRSSPREDIGTPDEKVESSIALLRERLKSFDGRLKKSADLSEAKIPEEATEPVFAKGPEEDFRIDQTTDIREKTKKLEHAPITTQKYHIVESGETLNHVLKKYNVSIDELGEINIIDPSQLIHSGKKLLVSKDSKK